MTPVIARHCARLISRNGTWARIAALLTRTSSRPNRSPIRSAMPRTAVSSVTSARQTMLAPPRLSISAATPRASASEVRAWTTTAAPSAARLSAMARPIRRSRHAALGGEIDQPGPIAHRHQMAIDEMQPAAAPPIEEELVRQGIEFRLVDDVETTQGHLLAGTQHDARLVADEQPLGAERPHERRRRRMLGMELAAEGDGFLQQLGRLAAVEKRPLGGVDDESRLFVETDDELAAAGLLHEDEGIATDIGGNIGLGDPPA